MKVGLDRDECLVYFITSKAENHNYPAEITVEQYNAIIKISKQFWQMQDVLEKMYKKAREKHERD